MANANPTTARRAKRRKQVAAYGGLDDLRARLWEAVETAADSLSAADTSVRLRACHALTQTAASYVKLVEATEFEARLVAVEKEVGLSLPPTKTTDQ